MPLGFPLYQTVFLGRNYGFCIIFGNEIENLVGVLAPLGQDCFKVKAFQ